MNDRALVVFTAKSREDIVNKGGTGDWVLTPSTVRQMKFALCTRNSSPVEDPGPGSPGPEPHGSGFLAGRISGVRQVGQHNGRNRYLVEFDAVADVDIPDVWEWRNPVRYMDLDELKGRGVDFSTMTFRPLTKADASPGGHDQAGDGVAPLTIAQAKAGLSASFAVPVDSIEITIKG
jgi:hypothetical protein